MQIHVIGDLHGHYPEYEALLRQAEIVDKNLDWRAADNQLWLIGDLFDRGNQAVACLDLTMKIQQQANTVGGVVQCLMGNHELMFLAANKFVDTNCGQQLWQQWIQWGGQQAEMGNITDAHISWLCQLPAMAQVGDRLLIHGDNLSYVNYGTSIDEVNDFFLKLMENEDSDLWQRVLIEFSGRGAFDLGISGPRQAHLLLKMYGGKSLIHGHTPIPFVQDIDPSAVTAARNYADGHCCNVDGGIYLGSAGFVYSYNYQGQFSR
ncbi:MAG: metallophosphoesterase [bacterium]|nr:hypothetical protein [Gammaproteobacteria bacterium]HIL96953.1 hypothetical protein [Pseudomonadales bacterium]